MTGVTAPEDTRHVDKGKIIVEHVKAMALLATLSGFGAVLLAAAGVDYQQALKIVIVVGSAVILVSFLGFWIAALREDERLER